MLQRKVSMLRYSGRRAHIATHRHLSDYDVLRGTSEVGCLDHDYDNDCVVRETVVSSGWEVLNSPLITIEPSGFRQRRLPMRNFSAHPAVWQSAIGERTCCYMRPDLKSDA